MTPQWMIEAKNKADRRCKVLNMHVETMTDDHSLSYLFENKSFAVRVTRTEMQKKVEINGMNVSVIGIATLNTQDFGDLMNVMAQAKIILDLL